MSDRANRAYFGRCQYPGKKEFALGTVVMAVDATYQEVSDALRELWERISPYPAPEFVKIVPGMVIAREEGEPL